MKNEETILKVLNLILAPHDAAWEDSVVAAYVLQAHRDMSDWAIYLGKPGAAVLSKCRSKPRYVRFLGERASYSSHTMHAEQKAELDAGLFVANLALAEKDGKLEYQDIRAAFIGRVSEKIAYICQGIELRSTSIVGSITFNRMIEGRLYVTIPLDTRFGMKVAIKTNYRHGENSANGRLTVYSQYPVTFEAATIAGAYINDPSEELLANKISGIPMDFKVRTAQAVIDERKAARRAKNALKDRKDAVNRIADEYDGIDGLTAVLNSPGYDPKHIQNLIDKSRDNIAKRCAKHGIVDPGSKKAALALRKQLLTEIRAMATACPSV